MTLRILKCFEQHFSPSVVDPVTTESLEDDLPRVSAADICLSAEVMPAQLQSVTISVFSSLLSE